MQHICLRTYAYVRPALGFLYSSLFRPPSNIVLGLSVLVPSATSPHHVVTVMTSPPPLLSPESRWCRACPNEHHNCYRGRREYHLLPAFWSSPFVTLLHVLIKHRHCCAYGYASPPPPHSPPNRDASQAHVARYTVSKIIRSYLPGPRRSMILVTISRFIPPSSPPGSYFYLH